MKFEMPYYMPLASDSIEVQLWNWRKGRPDELIAATTFSFYQKRLVNKSWGPEWVNFYSPNFDSKETTALGSLRNTLTRSAETVADHEYVGRVLLRLSTAERNVYQPKLNRTLMTPAPEPQGVDFTVYMLLYSASELPCEGGHVQVEVCFGEKRSKSGWVMGKTGTFVWNALLKPIEAFCPIDTTQVHDVLINVYHRFGSSVRKISFERITVTDLLMGRDKSAISNYLHNPSAYPPIFFINGTAQLRDRAPWRYVALIGRSC
jgi:hypothetical protein